MKKIDVSVIMCNYNYADFIEEAISSVLNQTYKNFELIIVDDGSKDDSAEKIRSFKDPRLKFVCQENRGQGGAFNTGFSLASGSIIFFIDSDDYWYEDKLEKVIKEHSYADFVQHRVAINGNEIYPVYTHYTDHYQLMLKYGISDFFAPTSAISVKKNVLENFFPIPEEPLKICADAYITRMSLSYTNLKCMDDVLSYYRIHGENFYQNKIRPNNPDYGLEILELLNIQYRKVGKPVIPYRNYYNPPGKKWIDIYNSASNKERKGLLDKAEEEFLSVLESQNLNLCCGVYFHLGKIALLSAITNFEKCVALMPKHAEASKLLQLLSNSSQKKIKES